MLSREIWLGDPTDFVQERPGNFNGLDPGVDPTWHPNRGFFWSFGLTDLGLIDPQLVYQQLGKLTETPVTIRRLQLNMTGQSTWTFELVDGTSIIPLKNGTIESAFYAEWIGTLTPGQKARLITTGAGTSDIRMVVTLELASRRLVPSVLVGGGGSGGSGTTVVQIIGEIPVGFINNFNLLFTTAFPFIPGTTRLYLNGVRQRLGASFDYVENVGFQSVTFTLAPRIGDTVLIDYFKA